jgi:DnaK suppressor protein
MEDLKFYKTLLEKRKLQAIEEIENIRVAAKPVKPDNAIGRLTRMDAITQKSIFDVSLANAKLRLEQIEQAFFRIDADDFGYCLSCEEEIGDKRLASVAESAFCIECMQHKES